MPRPHILLALIFTTAPAKQAPLIQPRPAQPAAVNWPTHNGTLDLPNFHFRSGETLPNLHLHYLTLGTAHRNAAGHTDNAVLLLHGTGGDAHSLLARSSRPSSSAPASRSILPNTSLSRPMTSPNP